MLPTKLSEFYADTGPERVGFVLNNGKVVEVNNVCPDPENGFEVNPIDIIMHEEELVGVWHTHPGASSNLSMDDHAGIKNWPNLTHYIIGKDGVRAYKVNAGSILIDDHGNSPRLS